MVDSESLYVKMKSGAYMFADRVGTYVQELSLRENFGFELMEI